MNTQFLAAVNQICAEKNIEREIVLGAVKSAIATAYRKDYGNKEQEIDVILRDDVEFATILLVKEVVEEVENENFEISLQESKKIKKGVSVGDEIQIDVTPVDYGRIAAQSAKQVILQKLHEAERTALYERFKDREDRLLTSLVSQVEGTQVLIEIEKSTVQLPLRQQIPNERYFPGKRMRVYLEKVAQTTKGPQLQVSRTHPQLVERLLEQEIPEVEHGDVEVMAVARDPGFRSKVAVKADEPKIDPVGACIGQRGSRIQPVMDELGGERVDIIEYDPDPTKLIARSLQPAEISHVVIVTPEEYEDTETGKRVKKRAAVFVDEEQRAMAIGKKGQNIRLASQLTEFELDMYNAEEYEPFKAKLQEIMDGGEIIESAIQTDKPEAESSDETQDKSPQKKDAKGKGTPRKKKSEPKVEEKEVPEESIAVEEADTPKDKKPENAEDKTPQIEDVPAEREGKEAPAEENTEESESNAAEEETQKDTISEKEGEKTE